MSGDVHVRFCERLGVRFPRATRRNLFVKTPKAAERVMASIGGYALREEPCTDPYARFCGQTGAAAPSDPISGDPMQAHPKRRQAICGSAA